MEDLFKIENSPHYPEGQKLAIKLVNGEVAVEDVIQYVRKIKEGSSTGREVSFKEHE